MQLVVSDSGRGMDRETLDKIFEPFFTTKGIGSGTGLGLATVYGIVQQNSGFINVYSEPGAGTTFRVYLPRHAGPADAAGAPAGGESPRGRGETVLLVEDEPKIMRVARRMLELQGYVVLAAPSPAEAIRLAGEHAGAIDLLMTDMVMPGMNGRDLAARIREIRPAMACLFTSGYTADAIVRNGVLEAGVHFLQKPFSIQDLAVKVREALGGVTGDPS